MNEQEVHQALEKISGTKYETDVIKMFARIEHEACIQSRERALSSWSVWMDLAIEKYFDWLDSHDENDLRLCYRRTHLANFVLENYVHPTKQKKLVK